MQFLSELYRRIQHLTILHPLKRVCSKYKLQEKEFAAVILVLYYQMANYSILDPISLCNLLARNLVLPYPDFEARIQLWKVHLPKSIPGSENIDIVHLVQKYLLTGGQIRIIVQNACKSAMLRGGNARLLQIDLGKYAQLEVSSSFQIQYKKSHWL